MMENHLITIGIRAAPTFVVFAIFDTEASEVLTVEKILIPVAFDLPDALKYARSNLLDILREFKVEKAGIRMTEPNAKTVSIARVQLEGVILEAFASSELQAYYIGHISSISSRLGIDRTEFKPMVENKQTPDIESWSEMEREEREAILCAKGAEHA